MSIKAKFFLVISVLLLFLALFLVSLHLYNKSNNKRDKKITKKAIVIGATSGMGRAVAKLLSKNGYEVGLVGRRIHLLESLQKEIATNTFGPKTYIKKIDVSQHANAQSQLQELVTQMGGLDLMFISVSAYSSLKKYKDIHKIEKRTLDVDLVGFWKMARTALDYFEKQKHGHLAGISSMSGLRGSGFCPSYSGAKAFISKYLEGVRNKYLQKNIPIYVTDIIPGWVDVEHTTFSKQPGTYWVAPLDKAALQIFNAIKKKKKTAYVTKRQRLIALLLAVVPDFVFNGIGEF
ncbi:SDR family NAD(P)-dependent oxidoreductase [Candidatus Dependentiae bacterium]